MADEKDKTQDIAPTEGEADKPAKPARAPRKTTAKPAAAKAAKADTAAAAKTDAKTDEAADATAAKPARRRAKPAADTAAKAKPARKRTAAAKATTPAVAPVKSEPVAPHAASEGRQAGPQARRPARSRRAHGGRLRRRRQAGRGDQAEPRTVRPDRRHQPAAPGRSTEQAARRSGSANTKTRGEVSGSTAKLYRQKGTRRARAGSVKSPTRIGGGTALAPSRAPTTSSSTARRRARLWPWRSPIAPRVAASTSLAAST